MIRFYTPYVAIWWKRLPVVDLRTIKSLGFDGVEAFLIGNMLSDDFVSRMRNEVREADLRLRFHQGWSWNSGQRIRINYILRMMRALTPEGESLKDQFRNVVAEDVVVYGNHALSPGKLPKNWCFQTASEYSDGVHYSTPIQSFLSEVQKKQLRVVFDTQHYLEWVEDAHFVSELPQDKDTLMRFLVDGWRKFSPHVSEIHLCDFNPKLGPTHGRNVFPGTGILDLKAFAEEVKKSGWSGIVTPEVKPDHLKNKKEIGKMLDVVKGYFS